MAQTLVVYRATHLPRWLRRTLCCRHGRAGRATCLHDHTGRAVAVLAVPVGCLPPWQHRVTCSSGCSPSKPLPQDEYARVLTMPRRKFPRGWASLVVDGLIVVIIIIIVVTVIVINLMPSPSSSSDTGYFLPVVQCCCFVDR